MYIHTDIIWGRVCMCIRRESHFHPRTNHFLRVYCVQITQVSRKYPWKELFLNSRLFSYNSIDTAEREKGRHVCCAGLLDRWNDGVVIPQGLRPLHHVILTAHIVQSDSHRWKLSHHIANVNTFKLPIISHPINQIAVKPGDELCYPFQFV